MACSSDTLSNPILDSRDSFIYTMLKMHFGEEEYYSRLRDLFLEVTQQTEFGQLLDLTSQPQGGPIDLNRFTETRYKQIVKYKTAFYTVYLPIAIGMITSGVTEERAYTQAKKICCIMGEYFQIQDDYLDCYGKVRNVRFASPSTGFLISIERANRDVILTPNTLSSLVAARGHRKDRDGYSGQQVLVAGRAGSEELLCQAAQGS